MSPLRALSAAISLAASALPAMAQQAPSMDAPIMDNRIFVHAVLDQFEARVADGDPAFRWEGEGWAGTDDNKFWIKTEGIVRDDGKVEDGRDELLYDRAISTYFDLQAGLRTDLDSGPTRNWAAFGIEGLAPLFFEVQATGYISDQGHFAGHFEASYDLLLTQRLILQPEAEINLYSKSDPGRGVGSGLADIDSGLRLRYEITRKFAPYIGAVYEGKFGQTATDTRRSGERPSDVRLAFGIRTWF